MAGQTVANAVIAKTSATGTLCLYASAATHLVQQIPFEHCARLARGLDT